MIHGVAGLLVAAAAGYWVLTMAEKEKAQLKKIGKGLGLIIIAVSLIGAFCKIYYFGCAVYKYKTGSSIACPYLKAGQ